MKFFFAWLILVSISLNVEAVIPTCSQAYLMAQPLYALARNGLQPDMVRLGFHDCVGGCNGCINFKNVNNRGLEDIVDQLKNIYTTNRFSRYASLADFYAYAAVIAVVQGTIDSNANRKDGKSCPVPCFFTRWGRVTKADCSGDNTPLPSGEMTGAAMFQYFQTQFGFTPAHVVALMGAHSLGGADVENSGYSGEFIGPQNVGFSEIYYANMISRSFTWTNVNKATSPKPAKWQFDANLAGNTPAGFMLNTDFELFYNLSLDSNAKTTCKLNPTCGLTNNCRGYCPMQNTFSQALYYSKNCPGFINDFIQVYQMMLSRGYGSLAQLTCCP